MRDARVLVDVAERRARVVSEIERVAAEAGGRRVIDEELVDTITGLVEWPSGVLGEFEATALDMPRELPRTTSVCASPKPRGRRDRP